MAKLQNVIADLAYIRENLAGEFEWSPEGKQVFSRWYINQNEEEIRTAISFMRGYYGRKGDMVIKLAMISAAS